MTFHQLRALLAVAEAGSIRGAAAAMVVTEPSVSAAIAQLSRELGVPLTERVGRGIRLTEAGKEFARYAAQILGLSDRGVRAAREAAGAGGHLRLAAVTTAGEYVLPPILAGFLRTHPGQRVSVEVGNRASTIARLLNDEADLALGGRPPDRGGIAGEAFRDNPLVVVGPPDHPLRRKRNFDPQLLSGETWLLREPGSGTRQTTEEFLAASGIEPGSVMNVGSNGAIKRAVSLGLGVTLISLDAVAEELAAGELARLEVRGSPLRRSWWVLYREEAPLPPSARTFLRFLRSGRSRGEAGPAPAARARSRSRGAPSAR
ncbi:MAG TPA: LysR family transcriptional regulator [Actinomycetota bacterium]|nr:LysR family transcriptional regulator [Actinomycetota bacterium]